MPGGRKRYLHNVLQASLLTRGAAFLGNMTVPVHVHVVSMDFTLESNNLLCHAWGWGGKEGPGTKCHMSAGHIYSHHTADMALVDLDALCQREHLCNKLSRQSTTDKCVN